MSIFSNIIGAFTGSDYSNAANQYANQMTGINNQVNATAAPYISQEQQYLTGYLQPQMTAQNPALLAQHNANLGAIGANTQAGENSALNYWSQFGDTGRGRGEAQRVAQSGLGATLGENTGYGINTINAQNNAANNYWSGLGQVGNFATGIAESNAGRSQSGAQAQMQGTDMADQTLGQTVGDIGGMALGMFPNAMVAPGSSQNALNSAKKWAQAMWQYQPTAPYWHANPGGGSDYVPQPASPYGPYT
jgi:hypothetical protein